MTTSTPVTFALAALLAAGVVGASAPAAAEAPISRVVVYRDRAQVTRAQRVDCASGAALFAGLPATLDPRTLAAALDGEGGRVTGLAHAAEPAAPRAPAEALGARLRALDRELADAAGVLEAQRALGAKLRAYREHLTRAWAEQAIATAPPTATWDGALDLLRQQALAAARGVRDAEARQRDLREARAAVAADLARVAEAARPTALRVTVFVACAGSRTVRLAYVVPGATWRVAYQAHAERDRGAVVLVAQAIVQQGTGEDWPAVHVAVSTANLAREHLPPPLARLTVWAQKPASTTKVLTRRFERREHLSAGELLGGLTLGLRADAPAAGPAPTPAGAALGPALEIEASGVASVPADGREVLVTLDRRTLAAPLVLETVPKLYPFVYEQAALTNPFRFTMLPGPVALFVHQGGRRAFVGTGEMKLRAPAEPFTLGFGAVNEVQVERYVKQESLEGPGVLGSRQRLRHRYEIHVGNWSAAPRTIRVRENVPVAQHHDIDVGLDPDATPPTAWDRADGIVTWELPLAPRTKGVLTLSYTITVPSGYVVTGY